MRLVDVQVGDAVTVEHLGRLVPESREAVVVWRHEFAVQPQDETVYLRQLQEWLQQGSCDFTHNQRPRYGIVVREDRAGRRPHFYAPHPDRLTLIRRAAVG
jgi:hypothetical protein